MPGKWIAAAVVALPFAAVCLWIAREIIIDVYDAVIKAGRK